MDAIQQSNKVHRKPKDKNKEKPDLKGKNPKAFVSQSGAKAARLARRKVELDQQRLHVPAIDRTFNGFAQGSTSKSSTLGSTSLGEEGQGPPPVIVGIIGPAGVGKSTLVRSLVRRYTKITMSDIKGPVTVVSGKSRRLTFIECPNDLGAIIDLAKIADLVLLMIDGSFGFEMEVFEALSAMSSHGLPKIIAVLTHLDLMKKPAIVKAQKKKIKQRFWTEVYDGAKMFYLSGVMNGRYPDREILNLSRFINVAKFRPLIFRNTHPYFLADRIEDLTSRDLIRQSPKEDRTVALYGYLRGIPLRPPSETHDLRVHIPGSGVDAFSAHKLTRLPDPCPLPTKESEKRRKLSDKDRICHAPMSGGGSGGQITVDADTVYINTAGSFSRRVDEVGNPVEAGEGEQMVMDLQDVKSSLADNIAQVEIRLFGQSSAPIRVNKNTKEEDPDFDTDEDASDLDEDEVDSELVLDQEEEAEESVEDSGDLRSPQTGARNKHRQRRSALASLTNEDHEPNAEEIAFDDDSDVEISANDNGSTIDEEGNDLEDDSDDNVEEKEDEPKWKQNLSVKAQTSFDNRLKKKTKDWTKLIYSSNLSPEQIINGSLGPVLEEDEDELFQVARVYAESEDCFKPPIDRQALKKWQDDAMLDSIRHRFITGSLDANGIGTEGGKEYDSETGEGFVDLEGEDEEDVEGAEKEEQIVEDQGQEDLAKKKEQLKRKFDQQYDNESDSDAGEDFFTTTKKDMLRRLETTRAEFANETLENRAMLEGHHPGCYVRLEISGVPSELLEKFDPTFPLLVGGLLAHEESFGYVTVRLKKHRWAPRILKTNDPLVFSVGWRRFQSIPLYSLEDGTRNRLLKYTPEHMHCLATFYGPISNPQTGFCAFNSVALQAGFRVSASGTVIDIDASTAIVKKLKLTGTPYKIFKNTAFIKDMFTSSLEVAKFEGAQIRTVSGIRGQIKKALAKPEGTYRATFEDRILSSDIIFLRSWTKIEPRNFYYPMDSLLLPDKSLWQGMRLTGQVRAEEGVKTPSLSNSQYKAIDRPTRRFNTLKVPRKLQAALPYASKSKLQKPRANGKTYLQKRAVILEPEEKRALGLLQQISAISRLKTAARTDKQTERREAKMKQIAKGQELREDREKRERKEQYRTRGMQEKRKAESSGEGRSKKRRKA